MLNQVNIIGNLTQDTEIKTTTGGKTVANFSVATTLKWKDGENTEFHNVIAWGKLAEICGQYLKKGMKVYVGGRLQTRNWDKDGVKHYRTEIIADNMKMLGKKETSSETTQAPTNETPGTDEDVKVENIPF